MKPQLAEDAHLELVRFPVLAQPKIDGVRALNLNGTLTGRSLKPFPGFGVTDYFSQPEFHGFDGEMTLGDSPNGDRLCALTTGALARFEDVLEMADLHWWVFDYLTPGYSSLHYADRLAAAVSRVMRLNHPRVHFVPTTVCQTKEELYWIIQNNSEQGYEGTIIRNPKGLYKEGRATKKGQELWRVKPWADAEMLVTGITEGAVNTNEAKKNALGRTERSSSKEGLVPNGQVGSIQGILIDDVFDPFSGNQLFTRGQTVTCGSGAMTVEEATYYFQNPHEILGSIVKFKHMTYGIKDAPRFPTYLSHRLREDMS